MAIRNSRRPLRDPGLRNILEDLRNRMMDGRLPAASRLPSVRELASTYGVATTTIHRCLQELAAAGFISTHGWDGTRVAEHPPHRFHFGMVLPELPRDDGSYAQCHLQAKALAAHALTAKGPQRVEIFHGVDGHPELPEHQRLLTALDERRLAGLIMFDEVRVREWLIPATLGIPVIGAGLIAGSPAVGELFLDLSTFIAAGLEMIAHRQLHRVAVLLDVSNMGFIPKMVARAKALKLDLSADRIQCLPTRAPTWAYHVLAGLLRAPATQRPEALIITDEGVIPAVQEALTALHADDIFQIHMANLPLPSLSRSPAMRIGWDHELFLLRAIGLIDAWHEHQRPIGINWLSLTKSADMPSL